MLSLRSERSRWEREQQVYLDHNQIQEILSTILSDCCLQIVFRYLCSLGKVYVEETEYQGFDIEELKRYKNRFYYRSSGDSEWRPLRRSHHPVFESSKTRLIPVISKWQVQEPTQNQRGIYSAHLDKTVLFLSVKSKKHVLYDLPWDSSQIEIDIIKIQASRYYLYVFVWNPNNNCFFLLVYHFTRKGKHHVRPLFTVEFECFSPGNWTIFSDYLVHLDGEKLFIFDIFHSYPLLVKTVDLPIVNDPGTFNCIFGCGKELYVTEDGMIYRIHFS